LKDNSHSPADNHERKSYKKKYLLRKHQETEAQEEIKDFDLGEPIDEQFVEDSPKNIED